MNILFLCDEYPPCQHGGIGSVTQTLARAISERGHKVVVAGFYPYYRVAARRENDYGVEVYRFHYGGKFKLLFSKYPFTGHIINIRKAFDKYVIEIKELIKEYKIDIIESPDFLEAFRYSGPQVIKFCDFGIPLIVKLHGSYSIVNEYKKSRYGISNIYLKENILLGMASRLTAVSANVKTRVENRFKNIARIDILYNGLLFKNESTYQSNLNENNVVFAGTLSENKGVFNLIKSWEKVLNAIPDATLSIYGKGTTLSINFIKKLLTPYTKKSVILKGFVDKEDLTSIYVSASCAIFPSYSETFGMAPLEAMAVGCPTIFTKNTSGPEIIIHGVDGLLVDPNNIEEIADSIIFLLKHREYAIQIGQKACAKVREQFDISILAHKQIEYYERVINKNE